MQHNDPHDNLMPKDDRDIVSLANIWRVVPDFFFFLRRPFLVQGYQSMTTLALCQIAVLFIIDSFITVLIAILFLEPYSEVMGVESPDFFGPDESIWFILFLMSIIAPLTEETLFRGWLKGTKRALIGIGLPILFISGIYLIIASVSNISIMMVIIFLWAFIICFDGYLWLKKTWYDHEPIRFYRQNFPIIFYTSAGVFGLTHISNYEHSNYIVLIPMVITQFLGGLFLGYSRLRYGLLTAIIMHALHNAFYVLIYIMFPEM